MQIAIRKVKIFSTSLKFLLFSTGIPIGSSPQNVSLARQFELPERQLIAYWNRKRKRGHFMQLPVETRSLKISNPQKVFQQG